MTILIKKKIKKKSFKILLKKGSKEILRIWTVRTVSKLNLNLTKNGNSSFLEPGEYIVPFSFQIPESVPSSYESRNCKITYFL